MQDKRALMLRLLLNRYHQNALEALLQALPEEDSKKVVNIQNRATDVLPMLTAPLETVKKIHYSWLVPKLQQLPKQQAFLTLLLLPRNPASKVHQSLTLSEPLPEQPSLPIQSFLAEKLLPHLQLNDILPAAYLPQSEMNVLVQFEKKSLIDLIDLLGLYDLSQEIHGTIDKKILENIYKCLNPMKHAYLKQCLHTKEKLVTQKLSLELWDGDCQKLCKLLHHRGLVRLGYALSGQHPDLLWHLTHTLDTGRGQKLKRYTQEKEISGVTPTLRKHVQNVIQFLKKASPQ